MKFSRKLRILSHLLKKSLIENLIFYTVSHLHAKFQKRKKSVKSYGVSTTLNSGKQAEMVLQNANAY